MDNIIGAEVGYVMQPSAQHSTPSPSSQSDEQILDIFYNAPLASLPLVALEKRTQGQQSLGFAAFPENAANEPLSARSDPERSLAAVHTIHFGMLKCMSARLRDRRVSDRERAEYVRWFLQTDREYPHWHALTFETCCRLDAADPEVVRQQIFKQARRVLAS